MRWSGTEPKLRVMVEGTDAGGIETLAQGIAEQARAELA